MKNKNYIYIYLILSLSLSSCSKFLEEKSDKQLTTPTTVEDFRGLLSHINMFQSFCSLGQSSSDDFYLTDEDFNTLYYDSDKRLYTWQPDYVSRPLSSAGNEWQKCYSVIYVCNSVLHGIEENNLVSSEVDQIKGQALVYRAARYLDAVQIWAPVYATETATKELGLPLRLDPDMNIPSVRATVQQTYDQIILDLETAVEMLPAGSAGKSMPSKGSAYGLLARTYLVMASYDKALENASKALVENNEVIDFNLLNTAANFPIPVANQASTEIIFDNRMYGSEFRSNPETAKINPELLKLYTDNDLRRSIYYQQAKDKTSYFKGTHTGFSTLSTGVTTTEMLLILAECNVRLNKLVEAALSLNNLRIKRYSSQSYTPISFTDQTAALETVLEERRKELAFRGLRWSDIKRLNRDGAGITLTRIIGEETYKLPPNDKRYAIALPEDIIDIAKIPQNPR